MVRIVIKLFVEGEAMAVKKYEGGNDFEVQIKEYLKQGREKLDSDLEGTREAIKIIARDRIKDFIHVTDKGLDKREYVVLRNIIEESMHRSFCYGYGIGKIEGINNKKIFL